MITSTFSLAMHLLYSTYHSARAVGRVLAYALPYSTMASKIDFNTKHLKTGDALPPFNGKLRVYNMRFCPYAQRTILALNAKQVEYEVVNIDLIDKPEWLTSKSAFGKVPAIEVADDVVIYESSVTVEYLDEVYPQRPLLPKDPVTKAFDKIIVESFGAAQTMFYKVVKFPDQITEDNVRAYHTSLKYIEDQLEKRGTKFLDGSEPGYADYMIWPWFERLRTVDDDRVNIDQQKYKLLVEYINNMLQDPAVSVYLVPGEILNKFHSAFAQGIKPNYEILNEK